MTDVVDNLAQGPSDPSGQFAADQPIDASVAGDVINPIPPPPTPVKRKSRDSKHKKQVAEESGQKIFAWTILIAATALMMILLRVDRIFANTTPTGGDNAVHVWTGDYLKRVLIPQGRLFGWSNDSFAGLPVLSSYFPLPTWTIVALSYVIPYGIAFKIISAIGLFFLPVSVFRLGKKAELPWPEPLLLAAGAFPFLLARHFKILGGNIMSTMAGEFSFSISLCLTVLYMGSLITLLRQNRGRTRTTLLLAGVGLCHIVPAILAIGFTLACTLCELRKSAWKRQIGEVLRVGLTALALAAFWVIPFGLNIPYTNSMDYERNTRWLRTLIPILPNSSTLHTPADGVATASIFFVCALIGIFVGLRRRDRFIATMTLTAIIAGVQFGLAPRGAMWNNRLLPAWFFCVYVLGASGMYYTARLMKSLVRRFRRRNSQLFDSSGRVIDELTAKPGLGKPVLMAAIIAFGALVPAMISKQAHLPFAWANGNYLGTESRKAYPEYRNLITVLGTLPCGRLFSEPGVKRYSDYGSTMAMAALPYWTKSCIQTIDGLYFEASQTTPFSYLTGKWMSPNAAGAQRRLPYQSFDMKTGVDHLRTLGVRYVLLSTPKAKDDARKISALRFIESTGPFSIFEISDNAVVVPLDVEPVVVTNQTGGRVDSFVNVGIAQWVRPNEFPPIVADSGPKTWKRSVLTQKPLPTAPTPSTASTALAAQPTTAANKPAKKPTKTPEPRRGDGLSMSLVSNTAITPAVVSEVKVGNQGLSFRVSEIGKPVLVRISYFPNWKVSGATGPYRVGPNFMVVVPTRTDVALKYRYTSKEFGAMAVTLAGIAFLILGAIQSRKARRGRRIVGGANPGSGVTGRVNVERSEPVEPLVSAPQISGVLPPLEASTTESLSPSPIEQSAQQ
jgi:6-pyruvoyl-tetrahydropterin synthase related domain